MTRYAVALGSNLGDRVGHLRAAVDELRGLGEGLRVSGLYETAPIGGPEQGPYLNAVVVLDSERPPAEMLQRLQEIESVHDRERTIRWGPRTLDLDLVAMAPGVVDTPDLQIPHPRAADRRFVIEPLCDVWPEAMVGEGLTAQSARGHLTAQEVDRLAEEWWGDGPKPGRYWVGAQFVILLAIAVALFTDGSLPGSGGGLDFWRMVGAALLVLGGVLAVASARSLGRALTAMPEPVPGATLIDSGPYRYVRHPIYGAVVLALLGASLLLASTRAVWLSVGLLGFFWAKSSYEERQLRIAYADYSEYRTRVRHRLIPFIL